MNQKTWLRVGFLALLATTGVFVACDGDDDANNNSSSGGTTSSGGTSSSGGSSSGGTVDSGVDAAPKPILPKVALIHGANNAGPVRLCLATKGDATPTIPTDVLAISPLPFTTATSALPPGFGTVLPIESLDFSKLNLIPIVFKASALAAVGATGRNKTCGQVLSAAADAGGLVRDVDYWVLPEVKKERFAQNNSYVSVVVGCPAGITGAEAAKCGPGYTGAVHNLHLQVYQLDRSSGGAGNVVQFVHGAPAVDPIVGPVRPFIGTLGADGGLATQEFPLGDAGVTFAATESSTTAAPTPGAKTTAPLSFTSGVVGVAHATGALTAPMALTQILSNGGTPDPTFFKAGRGYTFIAVGDPTAPATTTGADGGPTFNPLTAHFLVFDNDPVVPAL